MSIRGRISKCLAKERDLIIALQIKNISGNFSQFFVLKNFKPTEKSKEP